MTRHDLSRVEAELHIALQLMNVARSSEDARMDAIFHVTIAHVLLTNPVATLIGTTSHTDRCLAEFRTMNGLATRETRVVASREDYRGPN